MKMGDLRAEINCAPSEWQSEAPEDAYSHRQDPVEMSSDLERILALPRRPALDLASDTAKAIVELEMQRWSLGDVECRCAEIDPQIAAGRRECLKKFLPVQAWALREMRLYGGILGSISVGAGKTVLGIMAPLALGLRADQVAVLLVPPSLLGQICDDYELLAQHMIVPALTVHLGKTRSPKVWRRVGVPTLHVLSFNTLSGEANSDLLDRISPTAIIADECFPYETLITTDEGDLQIGEIVEHGRGTSVLTYDHSAQEQTWKKITARMRKPSVKQLVRVIHEQGEFICTEDHKIWTDKGYVKAKMVETHTLSLRGVRGDVQAKNVEQKVLLKEMRVCESSKGYFKTQRQEDRQACTSDQKMRMVQEKVSDSALSRTYQILQHPMRVAETSGEEQVRNLQENVSACTSKHPDLLEEMHEETAEQYSSSCTRTHYVGSDLCEPRMSKTVQDQDERQRNHETLFPELWDQSRLEGQKATGLFAQTEDQSLRLQSQRRNAQGRSSETEGADISISRRIRSTDQTTEETQRSSRTLGRSDGTCHPDGGCQGTLPIIASRVPGRHRNPGTETGDRDRRQLTSLQEVEVSGSTQDRDTQLSRVVRVEILEQGSERGNRSSSRGDSVYDITVEDTHCYYAEGVLVSNCDAFADRQSARTIRLLRAFGGDEDTPPEEKRRRLKEMKFCGWTGSLMDAKIEEWAHLALLALRRGSPAPLMREIVEEWGAVINVSPNPAPMGALEKLCLPGESVRAGFARRIRETPGFIVAMDSRVIIQSGERAGEEVGISVVERKAPKIPDIVQEALAMVRGGERPDSLLGDGEEYNEILNDPMEKARHAATISAGVLLRWKFPPINGVPQRKEHIKQWYSARRNIFSEIREQIALGKKHLDSEKNCLTAAMRSWGDAPKEPGKPDWACAAWPAWRDIEKTVRHEEDEQWLSPWLVEDAAEWLANNKGIAWYTLKSWGRRLKELTGLRLHEGGPGAEARLKAEDGSDSIICSIRSNGRGRNGLQFVFHHQLVAQVPSSSKIWEQLSGRTVRRGQMKDCIFETYLHTDELRKAFNQALERSKFNEETWTGARYNLNRGWGQ